MFKKIKQTLEKAQNQANTPNLKNPHCPHCDHPLSPEHINIKEGIAQCPNCQTLSRLSELTATLTPRHLLLTNPPKHSRAQRDGHNITLTAKHFSPLGALGLTLAALFWNSITSLFVYIALSTLYYHLVSPELPYNLPTINQEDQDQPASLGTAILLCLFLTPFVLVGLAMIWGIFSKLFGSTIVAHDNQNGLISSGIGPLRRNRKFQVNQVTQLERVNHHHGENRQDHITLHAHKKIKFASGLSSKQTDWLYAALHKTLIQKDPSFIRRRAPHQP